MVKFNFGKKKPDKDAVFLDLKGSMKDIEKQVSRKEKSILQLKQKAMIAISQKNEKLAKIHLAKKLKQEKDIENLYNIQRKLSDQMDTIQQAETIKTATKALSSAVSVLNNYSKIIEKMNVEEIIADSEESMAIIEDAAEMMGDNTMDVLVDDEISQQLEELQAEVALNMASGLAPVPEEGDASILSTYEAPIEEPDADEVKQELEKLKKELEM